jgi:hypothetical protein
VFLCDFRVFRVMIRPSKKNSVNELEVHPKIHNGNPGFTRRLRPGVRKSKICSPTRFARLLASLLRKLGGKLLITLRGRISHASTPGQLPFSRDSQISCFPPYVIHEIEIRPFYDWEHPFVTPHKKRKLFSAEHLPRLFQSRNCRQFLSRQKLDAGSSAGR